MGFARAELSSFDCISDWAVYMIIERVDSKTAASDIKVRISAYLLAFDGGDVLCP